MPSQSFLDATRNGSFSTPVAWNSLANSWEASLFTATETEAWIDAGVEIVAQATAVSAGGLSAAEIASVRIFFPPTGPVPALADVTTAVALTTAVTAAGSVLGDTATMILLTSFFARLTSAGVTLSVPK